MLFFKKNILPISLNVKIIDIMSTIPLSYMACAKIRLVADNISLCALKMWLSFQASVTSTKSEFVDFGRMRNGAI